MKTTCVCLALGALLVAGCVMEPFNGATVESTTDIITFSGYSIYPDHLIRIYASDSPEGPFGNWPGAWAKSWSNPVISNWSGGLSYPLYPFTTEDIINPNHWGMEPGPGACTTPVTYVQMRDPSNDFALYTFDDPVWPAPHPTACINTEIGNGSTLYEAVPDCASEESPTIRITADPICP